MQKLPKGISFHNILKRTDITERLISLCGYEKSDGDICAHILKYFPEYEGNYFFNWWQGGRHRIEVIRKCDIMYEKNI